MFIDFCACQGLTHTIGGTLFIYKEIHKNTWASPDHRTENRIDHIAISWSIRRSLIDFRTKREAVIGSDHHLVVAPLRMRIIADKKKHDIMRKRLDAEIGKCTT
jgi:hypothetical protein